MANNPTFPTEVILNEKNIQSLVALYERAYSDIVRDILAQPDYSTARRVSLLNQIDAKLAKLGVDSSEKLGEYMPELYESGMNDAIAQLRMIRARVSVDDGFSLIHQAAVLALIDDTQRSFAESMTGFKRGVQRLLSQAVKDQISAELALGNLQGDALKRIKQTLKGIIETDGIPALVDRAGRNWSLDRYAEMLIRTKFVEARNRGLANRMAENGYDLVEVSDHNSKHAECAAWEGKILSLNGLTKGYPTVMDATLAGLFHPNCQHAINVINPELAAKSTYYDARTQTYKNDKTPPPAPVPLKIPNNQVTFKKGKNSATIAITEQEAAFIEQNQIGLGYTASKNKYGQFVQKYNSSGVVSSEIQMNLNAIAQIRESPDITFFHELGHAIDYLKYDPQNPYRRISGGAQAYKESLVFREAAQKGETVKVVATRLKNGSRYQSIKAMSDDEIERVLMGGTFLDDNGRSISFPAKYRNYLRESREVFADAYAQYRTQPEAMKQYAPTLFKLMEDIFNE